MATAVLSRRVERVVGYPPLSEMSDQQRREFHEAEGHAMLASLLFNATPDAIEPSRVIELLRDAVKEVADQYDEAAPTVADPSLEPIRAKADKADDALKRSVDAVSGPPLSV